MLKSSCLVDKVNRKQHWCGRAPPAWAVAHGKGSMTTRPTRRLFCVLLHSSATATLEDNFSGAVLACLLSCLLACSLPRSLACLLAFWLACSLARLLAWQNSATHSSPGTSLSVMRVPNVGDHQARHQDRFHGRSICGFGPSTKEGTHIFAHFAHIVIRGLMVDSRRFFFFFFHTLICKI